MAAEETVARAGTAHLPKLRGRALAAGGGLLLAAGAGILLFAGSANPPAEAPASPQSELARLMRDVALQIEAQVPFSAGRGASIVGASASGERLVLRMRLEEDIRADDTAAASRLAAGDASELCQNTDMRWLIDEGGTIERRYTDAGGDPLRTETSSCAGQPAPATRNISAAM